MKLQHFVQPKYLEWKLQKASGSHSLTKLHQGLTVDSLNIWQNRFTWKVNISLSTSNTPFKLRFVTVSCEPSSCCHLALTPSMHYWKREPWLGLSSVSCSSSSGYSVRSRVRTWLNITSSYWEREDHMSHTSATWNKHFITRRCNHELQFPKGCSPKLVPAQQDTPSHQVCAWFTGATLQGWPSTCTTPCAWFTHN